MRTAIETGSIDDRRREDRILHKAQKFDGRILFDLCAEVFGLLREPKSKSSECEDGECDQGDRAKNEQALNEGLQAWVLRKGVSPNRFAEARGAVWLEGFGTRIRWILYSIGVKERNFPVDRASTDDPAKRIVIRDAAMERCPLIPNGELAEAPSPAHLKTWFSDMGI